MTKIPTKKVLVFDNCKKLVGITNSITGASKITSISAQSISHACTGRNVASGRFYFRHLLDQIEVTTEDLGALKLVEYDQLCGIERPMYKTNKMTRKGCKYNKEKSEINEN